MSGETGPVHTSILDVQPPELRESKFLLGPPSALLCYNSSSGLTDHPPADRQEEAGRSWTQGRRWGGPGRVCHSALCHLGPPCRGHSRGAGSLPAAPCSWAPQEAGRTGRRPLARKRRPLTFPSRGLPHVGSAPAEGCSLGRSQPDGILHMWLYPCVLGGGFEKLELLLWQ